MSEGGRLLRHGIELRAQFADEAGVAQVNASVHRFEQRGKIHRREDQLVEFLNQRAV